MKADMTIETGKLKPKNHNNNTKTIKITHINNTGSNTITKMIKKNSSTAHKNQIETWS